MLERKNGFLLSSIAICLFSIVFYSCDDKSTQPAPGSKPFSLDVTVTNPSGQPASHLMISAWNHIENEIDSTLLTLQSGGGGTVFNTSIVFSLTEQSLIYLVILDSKRDTVTTYVQDSIPAGITNLSWSGSNWAREHRIYKLILSVYPVDTSGVLAYKDSIYTYYRPTFPPWSKIGFTNVSGTFYTEDTTLFPNTLAISPMIHTNESNDSLGELTIRDTVTFILTDTNLNLSQRFTKVIKDDSNVVALVWDTSLATTVPVQKSNNPHKLFHDSISYQTSSGQFTNRLFQNAPNPFR